MNEQDEPGLLVDGDGAPFGMSQAPSPGLRADGLFPVPQAAQPLPFIGERMTGAVRGQIEIEHYHRYCFARDLCIDRDVLDIASGEGYGAALLAGVARRVVGVDIDEASVAHARRAYVAANLEFQVGDALAIPVADQSIDVVTSFETLEHVADPERLFREFRRVLRPGGILCVSTPDRHVYSAPGQPTNPYHRIELAPAEFARLLAANFRHHGIFAQRALVGSIAAPLFRSDAEWRTYDRRSDERIEAQSGLSRAFYLVAVASDRALPPLGASVYAHSGSVDAAFLQPVLDALRQDHAALKQDRNELVLRVDRLRSEVTEATAKIRHEMAVALQEAQHAAAVAIANANEQAAASAARAAAHSEALEAELAGLRASTLWRATEPLRRLGRRAPGVARMVRGTLRPLYRAVRRFTAPSRPQPVAPPRLEAPTPEAPPDVIAIAPVPVETLLSGPTVVSAPLWFADVEGAPALSIVIPAYGEVDLTLRCLAAIRRHAPSASFEVIVAEDASGAADLDRLRAVPGLRFLENPVNLGFLRSCNAAAANARGRYLLLLNNDTEVSDGAIDAMLETIEAHSDAGIVGAKLIYPDGRLQEAGGIVWNDGTAWNFGRDDDPAKPEYAYLREVDYCSGCAILLRRDVWEELGGFDEAYVPAYYEDTDLAFRARRSGRRVLLDPRAVVLHHEGASHGTDEYSGGKRHMLTNRWTFQERWAPTLRREHFPNGTRQLRARDRSRERKLILVADHEIPKPDRDAGSRCTMAVLTNLVQAGWSVKFWPHNRVYNATYTPVLERLGIEVLDQRSPLDLRGYLARHGAELDHALLMRPDIAEDMVGAFADLRRHLVLSYFGIDIHHLRMFRQARVTEDAEMQARAAAMEALEYRLWNMFDSVIYLAEYEAAIVRDYDPGMLALATVPYCFDDFVERTTVPGNRDLLFVAGFGHPPNVDAAHYLVGAVLPLLRARHPDIRVVLAGSQPSESVRALAGDGVVVTGQVSDERLAELYLDSRVAVVPLRYGAGVKGKVVEALRFGLPLVTTSCGAEGIEGLERVVPICDEAGQLAAAIGALLDDDAAWLRAAAAQVAFARANFSRPVAQASLLAALAAAEQRHAERGSRKLGATG